jgi:hypothetical protein
MNIEQSTETLTLGLTIIALTGPTAQGVLLRVARWLYAAARWLLLRAIHVLIDKLVELLLMILAMLSNPNWFAGMAEFLAPILH